MPAPLATLARNLVRATPTVIGSPARARTSARSRRAICSAVPLIRRNPSTSRNASSMEIGSTIGVVSRNTAKTALLAAEYAPIRGGTTTACGQSARAWERLIGVRTPNAFAS